MYDLDLEEKEQAEYIARQKSIDRFVRFVFITLFLIFVSFTVASIWQARLRQKELDIYEQNYSILNDYTDEPKFSIEIATSTEESNGFVASWYDYDLPGFPNYSKNHFTAASRDYPKGTQLIVCDDTKHVWVGGQLKCVQVRVNDFGPNEEHPERLLDLSSAAFKELAPLSQGIVPIVIFEKVHIVIEPLKFFHNEDEDGSKIDESKNDDVHINPIYKPVDL